MKWRLFPNRVNILSKQDSRLRGVVIQAILLGRTCTWMSLKRLRVIM